MKTIYPADDDKDDRMFIRMAMEQEISDVRILELSSGDLLIDALEQEKATNTPAVIIMDMNMPRMNGLETLSYLKSNTSYKHIPVVMLSTTSDEYLVRDSYNRGVNAFIEKPIFHQDFARLVQAIDVCFLNASHPAENSPQQLKRSGGIIIIEDDEDQLYFLRLAIRESMPFTNIYEYTHIRDVLLDISHHWSKFTPPPKLILMDLYLPTSNKGLDLLIQIQQLLVLKGMGSLPVVVFTNSEDPDDMKASYASNANTFMTKNSNMMHWKNDFKNLHRFW
ncbi:response regulator [Dyadobacter sp. CY312]|uniref:response regulator n=1 Tax=Dyadobacter sp. CY312 TaxID=2907303 RepID=UPI001F231C71|nr:response regulator [Dyadobacter sp. CY312]MCE7042854.1 response regulator [Dyadobacter sp. CY312]